MRRTLTGEAGTGTTERTDHLLLQSIMKLLDGFAGIRCDEPLVDDSNDGRTELIGDRSNIGIFLDCSCIYTTTDPLLDILLTPLVNMRYDLFQLGIGTYGIEPEDIKSADAVRGLDYEAVMGIGSGKYRVQSDFFLDGLGELLQPVVTDRPDEETKQIGLGPETVTRKATAVAGQLADLFERRPVGTALDNETNRGLEHAGIR